MTIVDVRNALDQAVRQRRLLDHPFYRAWEAGELTRRDLGDYAAQYRHTEQILPAVLEATASGLPAGRARRLVEDNLADERSRPRPHLELFEDFAAAVGAAEPDTASGSPSPATFQLVETYRSAALEGPIAGLAVLGAYEVQAAEVAATKAASLRDVYGLDATGTAFWDVHAGLESSHADWTAGALAELSPESDDVSFYATASAAAWWGFLDEREAARRG